MFSNEEKVKKGKRCKIFGKIIHHFPLVESTNSIAFSLAEKGEKEGAVIIADRQLKGEGRRGKDWFSPPGGLWFSLILRPCCPPEDTFIYPLMAAAAVVKTIKKIFSCPACISWPNDIVVREKKIGGTMCRIKVEREKVEFAILGVGVNLNVEKFPPSLQNLATSLLLETGRLTYPFYFLDCFLTFLEDMYTLSQIDQNSLLEKIKKFFPFTGKLVRLSFPAEDKIVWVKGIDYRGCLIVESENGVKEVIKPPKYPVSLSLL